MKKRHYFNKSVEPDAKRSRKSDEEDNALDPSQLSRDQLVAAYEQLKLEKEALEKAKKSTGTAFSGFFPRVGLECLYF